MDDFIMNFEGAKSKLRRKKRVDINSEWLKAAAGKLKGNKSLTQFSKTVSDLFRFFPRPRFQMSKPSKGFYGFPKWLSKGFHEFPKFLLGLQSKLPNVHIHSPRLQLLASPRLRFDKQ